MSDQKISIKTGSVWEALRVALPLVIAASGHAIKLFTDRIMLSHYHGLALTASLSAGVMVFMLMSFWLASAGYTNSFVAQYIGAGRPKRVGPSIWQGMILGLIGGGLIATGYFWGDWFLNLKDLFFNWLTESSTPRDPLQMEYSRDYFRILCLGTWIFLANQGVLAFWNGRGKTWMVCFLEVTSSTINFVANYLLIFGDEGLSSAARKLYYLGSSDPLHQPGAIGEFIWGDTIPTIHWGLESHGIVGAAWGTNISGIAALVIGLVIILRKKNREKYNTLPRKPFEWELFKRLLKFGLPNGINMFLDIISFNVFIQLLAGMGPVIGMASTTAFSYNAIAFIPMIGIGITASIFVGQSVGANKIPLAIKAVRSCRTLVLIYMTIMITLFIGIPDTLTRLFPLKNIDNPQEVHEMTKVMLRYIAAYLLFDGLFILYNSAIKGAGDTRFSMWVSLGLSWGVFAIPSCIAVKIFGASVWTLWTIFVIYVVIAGPIFYIRYRRGKWQRMRIIEET